VKIFKVLFDPLGLLALCLQEMQIIVEIFITLYSNKDWIPQRRDNSNGIVASNLDFGGCSCLLNVLHLIFYFFLVQIRAPLWNCKDNQPVFSLLHTTSKVFCTSNCLLSFVKSLCMHISILFLLIGMNKEFQVLCFAITLYLQSTP